MSIQHPRHLARLFAFTCVLALAAAATVIGCGCGQPDDHDHVVTGTPPARSRLTGVAHPTPVAVNDAITWVTYRPPPRRRSPVAARGGRSSSSIEACILARENGGDYGRSSNPTHFGAYQFDRSTWTANGGNPDTWGTASSEEQDRVFRNTVAAHGYSAWTPYDGC